MASSSVDFDRFAHEMYLRRPDEEVSNWRQQKEAMVAAIHDICETELTDKQRTAMELCFFQGFSVTRAAEMMGVHKSTVSRHISGAKARIEKSLRYVAYPLWRGNR